MILSRSQYINIIALLPLGWDNSSLLETSFLHFHGEFTPLVLTPYLVAFLPRLTAHSARVYFPTESKPPALQSSPLVLHLE